MRRRQPRCRRPRRSLRERVARYVRQLFGGASSTWEWPDDADGGAGVREPRRPLVPSLSGSAALDVPPADRS